MSRVPNFTSLTRRALFVARRDVLYTCKGAYPRNLSEVEYVPGAIDALFYAGQLGWRIYLFDNEDQVADGSQADSQWQLIEDGIVEHLRSQGVNVVRSYSAIDRIGGVEGHDKESVYTTPNTGVMHHARQSEGIHLEDSWVVASNVESLVSGWRAGCATAGVGLPRIASSGPLTIEPDVTGSDLTHTLAAMGARPPLRKRA